jgi:small subunit ribosomal protein S2
MSLPTVKELLDSGVHFGHLRRKWNPKMSPYIFMERNGIHIIDLNKSLAKLDEAAAAIKQMAASGRKILFVSTKKQGQEIIANAAQRVNMPYVTERWPGGMLTNFATIRKAIRKMGDIDKMEVDGTFATMSKRERLMMTRQRAKLQRDLGSVADLTRLPSAIFIVDTMREHIALAEAKRLNIPTFAITDTNSDPTAVDFAIPGNDDATAAIEIIVNAITDAVAEGLAERKASKDKPAAKEDAVAEEAVADEAPAEEGSAKS